MKKAIFISLLSIVSVFSFGQSRLFDRNVDSMKISSARCAIPGFNGTWLIGGTMRYCDVDGLLTVNTLGNGQWSTDTLPFDINNLHIAGNTIYATGDINDHSDVSPAFGAFVIKYDSLSRPIDLHIFVSNSNAWMLQTPLAPTVSVNQIWSTNTGNTNPRQSSIIDSNTIWISIDDKVIALNLNDWSIRWSHTYSGIVHDISTNTDGRVYLATEAGILLVDTSGTVIKANLSVGRASKCYRTSNKNYLITYNKIIETDTSLAILSQYPVPVNYSGFNGLCGANNLVYTIEKSNLTNTIYIAVLDTGLAFIDTIPLESICSVPFALAAQDSLIIIAGGQEEAYYRTYSSFGNSHISKSSLQLTSLHVDSQIVLLYPTFTDYYAVTSNIAITLTNTGNDTITSFRLRTAFTTYPGLNGCMQPDFILDTSGIQVPPLATIVAKFHSFENIPNTGLNFQINYFLTSVNGALPTTECGFPFITDSVSYTSIHEITPPYYHIYPNPTNNILNIQTSEATNATIFISDLTGKILMQQLITSGTNQINIGSFAQGMYIYTIKDGIHNPVTGKIEKI